MTQQIDFLRPGGRQRVLWHAGNLALLVQMRERGDPLPRIADYFGVQITTIASVLRRYDLPRAPRTPVHTADLEAIQALHDQGRTAQQIANALNFPQGHVVYILRRYLK